MVRNTGFIVIGYQGIGKSTCAKNLSDCIDFESSLFKIDGDRDDNWYVIYCRQAVSLAKQGYTVFVSSHKDVRDELAKYDTEGKYVVVIIAPHYRLKDCWIAKLNRRYSDDPTDKNYIAWQASEARYDADILDLASDSRFSFIFIESMQYHFSSMIRNLRLMYETRTSYYYRRVNPETQHIEEGINNE